MSSSTAQTCLYFRMVQSLASGCGIHLLPQSFWRVLFVAFYGRGGSTDIGPLIDTSFAGKQRGSNWGRIRTKFSGYYLSGFETGLKGPAFCFLNYGFHDYLTRVHNATPKH